MARKGSGTCSRQESLSCTLTLTFPVTDMESMEQIVQLPLSRKPLRGRFSLHNRQQPKGTSYRSPQAKAWQGGGGGGTQGEGVPEDRPYLRARLLTSASAPPSPGTPDTPTKRSPSKCLAGKGAQRQT